MRKFGEGREPQQVRNEIEEGKLEYNEIQNNNIETNPFKEKIRDLLPAIDSLAPFYNPDNGWYAGDDDDGRQTWNHWSASLDELKNELDRNLTDEEITI
jgi:hypothetical protein